MTGNCWLSPSREFSFVHLGKFGDLMILFPAFQALREVTGIPPVCYVAEDYASLFEGISYASPRTVRAHWWRDVARVRDLARQEGRNPIVIKWWDLDGAKAPFELQAERIIELTIHGRKVRVPSGEWDSFQTSQWRYAGFTVAQMLEWPLVFDRRDAQREADLRAMLFKTDKPKALYNLSRDGTSPFRSSSHVMERLRKLNAEWIDLGSIKAARIYDLLGLYDHAALLVTSDTATLHLAAASQVPMIAFINNGGAGSVPRGTCQLAIRYHEVLERLSELQHKAAEILEVAA